MNFVQLDKNVGDKRLREACLAEGIVKCDLLPPSVRDKEDDGVLEYVIAKRFVTLTFDREIHNRWGRVLAGRNPGIIILRMDDHSLQQMNTKTAPRYLREFKADFPDWHRVPCRHSVLELTPGLLFLYHTLTPTPVRVYWSKREKEGWQDALARHFQANADEKPSLLS